MFLKCVRALEAGKAIPAYHEASSDVLYRDERTLDRPEQQDNAYVLSSSL